MHCYMLEIILLKPFFKTEQLIQGNLLSGFHLETSTWKLLLNIKKHLNNHQTNKQTKPEKLNNQNL